MDDTLINLGLSEQAAAVYLYLLQNPHQLAHSIASQNGLTRTNAYRILDSLAERRLVVIDDTGVRSYSAAHPKALSQLIHDRQQALKQSVGSLTAVLPQLTSRYSLALDKPGVFYLAEAEGFEQLLEDMTHSQTEVLLIASNDVPENKATLNTFRAFLDERRENGVKTRALFHKDPDKDSIRDTFMKRGINVRFIGSEPFTGEVAIYEDNVAFTVYKPSLVTTVITNPAIAATMRATFEQLWVISDR